MNAEKQKSVLVGMSGGVDSSVAVYRLLEAGYAVAGATLRLADHYIEDKSKQYHVIERAAAVCRKLGIPHLVEDRTEEFDKCVVNYFADAYFAGRTPNPCVQCNAKLKWKTLTDMADREGITYVATGHYARIREEHGRYAFLKGRDREKDQSYFLWRLTQKNLARTLFPLGELRKPEVREIAAGYGLPQARAPESQDICFITDGNYREFLERYFPERAEKTSGGEFVDEGGRVIGRHGGYHRFTVGQRRGLGLAMGEAVYVRDIDPQRNTVRVAGASAMEDGGCMIGDSNWITGEAPEKREHIRVRIRYRNKGVPCRIEHAGNGRYKVLFLRPQKAVTPGQSAVFYDGDSVMGGGIIKAVLSAGSENHET